jgi:hypothetical protein
VTDRYHRWKIAILAFVAFLLFVVEVVEFLVWRFERILGPLFK